jgi:tetratricopeptide (TPR) repeat protein
VETLLAASKLEGLNVKEHLLTMATKSESSLEQTYLRAEIVYEWSVLFRFKGRIHDSERAIQEFLQRWSLNIQTLHVERLRISQAYNHVYQFNFCGAREALQWNPSNRELSEGETYLLCDQLYCNGRILRGEGRFDEAKECFEGCLGTVGLPESKRLLITSHLADLCCELDYMQQSKPFQTTVQTVYLVQGKKIVQREIDRIRESNRRSKGLRRLLLSLIEIELRQNHPNEAEKLTKEILDMYNRLTEPDIDDKVGHVRALIAWARISPACEAEERWTVALHQNKTYNPSEEEVFTCGVIYLFISSARVHLGSVEESKVSFNRAIEVISRKKPQFLIPGIGTYLFNYVTSDLWSLVGWSLPKIAT